MDGREVKPRLIKDIIDNIEAAHQYIRGYNPLIERKPNLRYIGSKLEMAMARLLTLGITLEALKKQLDME